MPQIKSVNFSEAEQTLSLIRRIVFIDEQQVDKELEFDGQDAQCEHFLIYSGSKPVGTARLQPSGKIERMAILKEARGQGLGRALLRFLLQRAREKGLQRVYMHAQESAVGFYAKEGFETYEDSFIEADIVHFKMQLALT